MKPRTLAVVLAAALMGGSLGIARATNWVNYAVTLTTHASTPTPTPSSTPTPSPTPTPGGTQPLGVAPPAGKSWVMTFDDEFPGNSVNTSKWNGGYSNTNWCNNFGCPDTYAGASVSNGILSLTPNSATTAGGLNTSRIFSQRYGYFEVNEKIQPYTSGFAGEWSTFFFFPNGRAATFGNACASGQDSGNEEMDLTEITSSSQANEFFVNASVHDQWCPDGSGTGTGPMPTSGNAGDLSTAFHTYGLLWSNDGSPHGTMCEYFDGAQQYCTTLQSQSNAWDTGIYLIMNNQPCPNGVSSCSIANTPIQFHDVRVWQAE